MVLLSAHFTIIIAVYKYPEHVAFFVNFLLYNICIVMLKKIWIIATQKYYGMGILYESKKNLPNLISFICFKPCF